MPHAALDVRLANLSDTSTLSLELLGSDYGLIAERQGEKRILLRRGR